MSIDDEMRRLVKDAVRDLLRDEFRALAREMAEATPASPFLRIADAAALVQVHPQTVRRWITTGKLPVHGEGRMVRVKQEDLERLLAAAPSGAIDFAARARDLRSRKKG